MTTSSSIGQKLWNYSNVLRDAGLSYGDYLEQLTYLLFLKMMHERSQPPLHTAAELHTAAHSARIRLAQPVGTGRRRIGNALSSHAGNTGQGVGHARGHIQQGSEQDPGAGDADAAHQGLDRQRELAGA